MKLAASWRGRVSIPAWRAWGLPNQNLWHGFASTLRHGNTSAAAHGAPVRDWEQMCSGKRGSPSTSDRRHRGICANPVRGEGSSPASATGITCKSNINFSSPIKPVSGEHRLALEFEVGGAGFHGNGGAVFSKVLGSPKRPPLRARPRGSAPQTKPRKAVRRGSICPLASHSFKDAITLNVRSIT